MKKSELFKNLQALVEKICLLEHEMNERKEYSFGPNSTLTHWPSGVPGRTNEPEAAILQKEDADEMIRKIEDQWEVIISMVKNARFEKGAGIMR